MAYEYFITILLLPKGQYHLVRKSKVIYVSIVYDVSVLNSLLCTVVALLMIGQGNPSRSICHDIYSLELETGTKSLVC